MIRMHVLRYYRKKHHLSVPTLARTMSMNASTIKVWETGHRQITHYVSKKLARFFQTADDLFVGKSYVTLNYQEWKDFSKRKSVYVAKKARALESLEHRIHAFLSRPIV